MPFFTMYHGQFNDLLVAYEKMDIPNIKLINCMLSLSRVIHSILNIRKNSFVSTSNLNKIYLTLLLINI
jgi:hypothetical protein